MRLEMHLSFAAALLTLLLQCQESFGFLLERGLHPRSKSKDKVKHKHTESLDEEIKGTPEEETLDIHQTLSALGNMTSPLGNITFPMENIAPAPGNVTPSLNQSTLPMNEIKPLVDNDEDSKECKCEAYLYHWVWQYLKALYVRFPTYCCFLSAILPPRYAEPELIFDEALDYTGFKPTVEEASEIAEIILEHVELYTRMDRKELIAYLGRFRGQSFDESGYTIEAGYCPYDFVKCQIILGLLSSFQEGLNACYCYYRTEADCSCEDCKSHDYTMDEMSMYRALSKSGYAKGNIQEEIESGNFYDMLVTTRLATCAQCPSIPVGRPFQKCYGYCNMLAYFPDSTKCFESEDFYIDGENLDDGHVLVDLDNEDSGEDVDSVGNAKIMGSLIRPAEELENNSPPVVAQETTPSTSKPTDESVEPRFTRPPPTTAKPTDTRAEPRFTRPPRTTTKPTDTSADLFTRPPRTTTKPTDTSAEPRFTRPPRTTTEPTDTSAEPRFTRPPPTTAKPTDTSAEPRFTRPPPTTRKPLEDGPTSGTKATQFTRTPRNSSTQDSRTMPPKNTTSTTQTTATKETKTEAPKITATDFQPANIVVHKSSDSVHSHMGDALKDDENDSMDKEEIAGQNVETYCCSYDAISCPSTNPNEFCNAKKEICETSCKGSYIIPGENERLGCVGRWGACLAEGSMCCNGLSCVGTVHWRSCQ